MRSFGVRKFEGLLAAGTFAMLVAYVVRLADAVVAGQLLGESALAAVNLVAPVVSVSAFVSNLIATGMATEYSLAMGRCDVRRAREFLMQAVWSALGLGGALALAIILFGNGFLAFMGATDEMTALASSYLAWFAPTAVVAPVEMILFSLCTADGDVRLSAAASAVVAVGTFGFAVLGVKMGLGLGGCAFGALVAQTLGILVLSGHFFRASNTFRPVRHFAFRDTLKIFGASFGDAASFLCDAVLVLVLNKFLIRNFGSGLLPVAGVVTALWGLSMVYNGIASALQPIVAVYFGERNTTAIRCVTVAALIASVLEGFLLTAFLEAFPQLAVALVGIDDPSLVGAASHAVRLVGVAFVPLAIAGLFNSYYMFVEKSLFAGAATFLCYLAMPVATVALGSLAGVSGVWLGLGLGPLAGIALLSVLIWSLAGSASWPFLLDRSREARLFGFSLSLSDFEIVSVSRRVAAAIDASGARPEKSIRASLLVEEVLMAVKDRARGRALLGEVTLDLNDGIRLTLRDDGEIFDITDSDQRISSLRSYLVASMMQYHEGKQNLVTTGYNRNVFEL